MHFGFMNAILLFYYFTDVFRPLVAIFKVVSASIQIYF